MRSAEESRVAGLQISSPSATNPLAFWLSENRSGSSRALACAAAIALFFLANNMVLASAESKSVDRGRWLAHEVTKGNCLACHQVPGDTGAITLANIGPPLLAMAQRFPDRARLREQIRDPMRFNADTVMPPFGKHQILTAEEIELVLDYLYTL